MLRVYYIQNAVREVISETVRQEIPSAGDRWFDLNEVCNYLPDKPVKPTVYGWVHSGLIPCHKGAKRLRFLKSEIDEWLKTGKQKTVSELADEAEQYLVKKKGVSNA